MTIITRDVNYMRKAREGNKITIKERKKAIKDFEEMKMNVELKALQKRTLEAPLTKSQFKRFKQLANMKIKGKI